MKRKLEDEVKGEKVEEAKQRRVCNYGGDGVSWFRGPLIGKGSFGSVHLATLKKPRVRYGCFPTLMAVKSAEISASASIQKEREVLNNIGDCPNIVGCFGDEITTAENGGIVYNLLLEYCSGGTLADLIMKSGGSGLPELDVRHFARSILRGVNRIHKSGYVHCDLKPQNILLEQNSSGPSGAGIKFRAKICDFGLARRVNQNKKRQSDLYLRGTPMYLSPEAVLENNQGPPSDVWAFGCIVLEMLTGKPPWKQDVDKQAVLRLIGESCESPRVPNEVSKEGKQFLKGCFARKSMFRLTTEMLLNHSYLEGLIDNDGDDNAEESEDILVADEEDSPLMLSDSEEDYGCSSSYSDEFSSESDEDCPSSPPFGRKRQRRLTEYRKVKCPRTMQAPLWLLHSIMSLIHQNRFQQTQFSSAPLFHHSGWCLV